MLFLLLVFRVNFICVCYSLLLLLLIRCFLILSFILDSIETMHHYLLSISINIEFLFIWIFLYDLTQRLWWWWHWSFDCTTLLIANHFFMTLIPTNRITIWRLYFSFGTMYFCCCFEIGYLNKFCILWTCVCVCVCGHIVLTEAKRKNSFIEDSWTRYSEMIDLPIIHW